MTALAKPAIGLVPWEAELRTVLGPGVSSSLTIYASNAQPIKGRFIMIYGEGGVGKTMLSEGLAESEYTRPVLHVDIDGSADALSHRDDIMVVQVRSWDDMQRLATPLLTARSLPFRSMVLDGWSELAAFNLLKVMGTVGRGFGIGNSMMASLQQYGANTAQMLMFARALHDLTRRLPLTIVATAWEAEPDKEGLNANKKLALFTPKMRTSLIGIIDIVGHLSERGDAPHYTRVLNFAKNPRSNSKFRRNRTETAIKIPLTIAYRKQNVMADLVNTLIGGEDWPEAQYKALATQVQAAEKEMDMPPQPTQQAQQPTAQETPSGTINQDGTIAPTTATSN